MQGATPHNRLDTFQADNTACDFLAARLPVADLKVVQPLFASCNVIATEAQTASILRASEGVSCVSWECLA